MRGKTFGSRASVNIRYFKNYLVMSRVSVSLIRQEGCIPYGIVFPSCSSNPFRWLFGRKLNGWIHEWHISCLICPLPEVQAHAVAYLYASDAEGRDRRA